MTTHELARPQRIPACALCGKDITDTHRCEYDDGRLWHKVCHAKWKAKRALRSAKGRAPR
jgi:hypothetical protein